MSQFLLEYGMFLLKAVTIVVAVVAIIGFAAAVGRKGTQEGLEVESLNKKYRSLAEALKGAVLNKKERKKAAKAEKERQKQEAKEPSTRPRSFVIDFKGDLKATAVPSLREEVSAVLDVATKDDEVVVRLENYGGVVHEHGLAASQLSRIRDAGIPLTVCVDKVAASGGYLMACVANRIYAAPFAILGSIGVLAQIPNFNRALDSHGIDFEQVTAGKYKRTVTMFGKNTDEDRAKLKEELEDVHALFKGAVAKYRPGLDLEKVATGEHWYGTRALEMGLADELRTSDELLRERAADRDLFEISYKIKQPLQKRLMANIDGAIEKASALRFRQRFESRLPQSVAPVERYNSVSVRRAPRGPRSHVHTIQVSYRCSAGHPGACCLLDIADRPQPDDLPFRPGAGRGGGATVCRNALVDPAGNGSRKDRLRALRCHCHCRGPRTGVSGHGVGPCRVRSRSGQRICDAGRQNRRHDRHP